MFEHDDFWRTVAVCTALVCITCIVIATGNVNVMWWYLVPMFIWGV